MTKIHQIHKCNVCGNMVEMVHASIGTLVCCNQPMELQAAKTEDQGLEKHVPVVEKTKHGIKIKVGAVAHPMEEQHHIEWIEVITSNKTCKKFLKAGDTPEVEFKIDISEINEVREFCNLHGLWKK